MNSINKQIIIRTRKKCSNYLQIDKHFLNYSSIKIELNVLNKLFSEPEKSVLFIFNYYKSYENYPHFSGYYFITSIMITF